MIYIYIYIYLKPQPTIIMMHDAKVSHTDEGELESPSRSPAQVIQVYSMGVGGWTTCLN